MKRPIFNVTQFYCKKCGQIVWINNDTREIIKNEVTGEYFSKEFGFCRWCFINKTDIGND